MLPARWRRESGVEGPTELVITAQPDGSLRIETRAQALRRAQELVAKYVPRSVSVATELMAERRRDAERE